MTFVTKLRPLTRGCVFSPTRLMRVSHGTDQVLCPRWRRELGQKQRPTSCEFASAQHGSRRIYARNPHPRTGICRLTKYLVRPNVDDELVVSVCQERRPVWLGAMITMVLRRTPPDWDGLAKDRWAVSGSAVGRPNLGQGLRKQSEAAWKLGGTSASLGSHCARSWVCLPRQFATARDAP
ncbi:hypothetical protein CC86DRAFT_52851 [Ophiobolus disseminans]|uniref:Uncharacterized protein n=1 Tax=Ophiobolus disseminans TaxID=1469910 RepID=A0A6A6ZUJ3_9PLEO|nr:hypothetical protein CC86DRAFT_52851 [Ophiobolus disseminans]